MGANATGPVAASLSERLSPACLAMSGVCAGNPGDVALGDVIVAEMTYAYDEGKRVSDEFLGDHRQIPLTNSWVRAAQELSVGDLPSYGSATDRDTQIWVLERLSAGDDPRKHPARERYLPNRSWPRHLDILREAGHVQVHGAALDLTDSGRLFIEEIVANDLDGPDKLPFSISVGPIASGNVVVKDGLTWKQLERWGVRSVLGLEMEAASIAQIAYRLAVPNWLVVKGVMDHADPRKDDRYKSFAARAAAEVLYKLVVSRTGGRARGSSATVALRNRSDGDEDDNSSACDTNLPPNWTYMGQSATDHFHRRSHGLRGGIANGDFFRGRLSAISVATKLLKRGLNRPVVITGQPGAGKSALLGRMAIICQEEIRYDGFAYHARGSSSQDFLRSLVGVLNAGPIVSVADLHEFLSANTKRPLIILVDALDECISTSETYALANLLTELARYPDIRVGVATRPLAAADWFAVGGLMSSLDIYSHDSQSLIDLDSERYRDPSAIANFAESILLQVGVANPGPDGCAWAAYRAAPKVARVLAETIALKAENNFLVAAIAASTLSCRESILDPLAPNFEMSDLPGNIGEALEKFLDTLSPDTRTVVSSMLFSLRFAYGEGIDLDTWIGFCQALGYSVTRSDIEQFKKTPAADFLIETTSAGGDVATRLYHKALIEQLSLGHPRSDAAKILGYLHQQVEASGGWENADDYIRRTILLYAAAVEKLTSHLLDGKMLPYIAFEQVESAIAGYGAEVLPAFVKYLAEETEQLDRLDAEQRLLLLYLVGCIHRWHDLILVVRNAHDVPLSVQWATDLAVQHSRLQARGGAVRALASGLLGHQQVLAAGCEDGSIRLWNSNGSAILEPLSVSGSPIAAVAIGDFGGRV
nr:hypothetical protein [Mycobacterium sp. MS1601]